MLFESEFEGSDAIWQYTDNTSHLPLSPSVRYGTNQIDAKLVQALKETGVGTLREIKKYLSRI